MSKTPTEIRAELIEAFPYFLDEVILYATSEQMGDQHFWDKENARRQAVFKHFATAMLSYYEMNRAQEIALRTAELEKLSDIAESLDFIAADRPNGGG